MKKDDFLLLLSKKLSGEISDEESKLLNESLKNPVYQQLSTQLSRYFVHKPAKNAKTERLKDTWGKINKAEREGFEEHFSSGKTRIFNSNWIKVAAVILLSIGVSFVIYNMGTTELDSVKTQDNRSFTVLQDGTQIWLNKYSTISYNQDFGKHKRELTLTGEAYFDVVKNEKVPLFIHARGIDIEVKGTAFNVNAYQENHEIQVALIRGLIQVTNNHNQAQKVLLYPNQKLIFSNEANAKSNFMILPLATPQLVRLTKWTSDTLVFKKQKLKDLAIQLEKKYELNIEIQSEQLKERRFSGTFTTETIQQALEALKQSYPLNYTISNKLVIIKD
jgi:transmembrane sensor